MRRAFSLIMAIIFILVLSVVGMLTLRTSAVGVQQTTGQYLREQADLLAIAAIEAAIYGIQDNNTSSNMEKAAKDMVEKVANKESGLFNIGINLKCIGTGPNAIAGECTGFERTEVYDATGKAITNKLQAVIITATVSTKDNIAGSEQVRYVKTVIQKP